MSDEPYSPTSGRRYRPNRRAPQQETAQSAALTRDFEGVSAAYGEALLFIGYEVEGKIEIVVYPRYRFSSDDRVKGYLGYLWIAPGTPWELILPQVEEVVEKAQRNYHTAITLRSREMRAHGSQFEQAYDTIADIFRESWHGFALRLQREGSFSKGGVLFSGRPPGPVLAILRGQTYTLMVFPSGSICMVLGDERQLF